MNEMQLSKRESPDRGVLILTNRRIVYVRGPETIVVPIENIGHVEETLPGFLIKIKDSFEPLYFFPPPYDPVFAAVKGAVSNFGKSR